MTATEIQIERNYRIAEREAILADGENPTPAENAMAREDADNWKALIENELRRERIEHIAKLAATNRRDYHLNKRFGK